VLSNSFTYEAEWSLEKNHCSLWDSNSSSRARSQIQVTLMRKNYQHVVDQTPPRPSQMKTFLDSAAMRSCIFVERCYSNIIDVKVPSFLSSLSSFPLFILLIISISFALSWPFSFTLLLSSFPLFFLLISASLFSNSTYTRFSLSQKI